MRFGYFPGCSLKSTAKEFDLTIKALCEIFGIELVEIKDWICCGATPVYSINEELSLALPLHNLINAEEEGLLEVLSPCPACYSHMLTSHNVATQNTLQAEELRQIIGRSYKGTVKVYHLLDFLSEKINIDTLKSSLKRPLKGLKVVSYYGCFTRLHAVELEDKENPTLMDTILDAIGAEPLYWSHKTECCGATLSLSRTEIALRLGGDILDSARSVGADCICVVCPLCQSNLDSRQREIEQKSKTSFNIPVVYLSQLILLALGKDYKELLFDKHIVDPALLLEKVSTL